MALDFYSQEDTFCDSHWQDYWAMEPDSLRPLDKFEMEEFDKLMPWVEMCNRQGIRLGNYFEDVVLQNHQLPQALAMLRQCYGEIAQRRPFLHHSESHKDAYVRMVSVLEKAIKEGRGIIAFCD